MSHISFLHFLHPSPTCFAGPLALGNQVTLVRLKEVHTKRYTSGLTQNVSVPAQGFTLQQMPRYLLDLTEGHSYTTR